MFRSKRVQNSPSALPTTVRARTPPSHPAFEGRTTKPQSPSESRTERRTRRSVAPLAYLPCKTRGRSRKSISSSASRLRC